VLKVLLRYLFLNVTFYLNSKQIPSGHMVIRNFCLYFDFKNSALKFFQGNQGYFYIQGVLTHTVRSESRCALPKDVESDVHEP
jgi:hypothetical protein